MNVIFDQNVYTRQPAVLTVSDWDGEAQWLKVVVRTASSVTTWYKLPTDESAFSVNLIEVIRYLYQTASSLSEVVISTYDEDKTNIVDAAQTISFSKAGTIDPAKVLQPVRGIKYASGQNADAAFKTWFPSKMIKSDGFADIALESIIDGMQYIEGMGYYIIVLNDEGEDPTGVWAQGNAVQIPIEEQNLLCKYGNRIPNTLPITQNTQFTTVQIWSQNYNPINTDFEIVEQDCCKTYAEVEWESSFGVTRRHIFEVTKQTDNADNVIAFETVGNGWDEHKGQLCGCTLRLENLNRYDYWYYADLILSDKAKITFDGSNWYTLQVTAKGYTLPDGDSGKLNTLEIPVNYCKYDTI